MASPFLSAYNKRPTNIIWVVIEHLPFRKRLQHLGPGGDIIEAYTIIRGLEKLRIEKSVFVLHYNLSFHSMELIRDSGQIKGSASPHSMK